MPSAVRLWEQCCAESDRSLGPYHPGTLARRASLAQVYDAVGRTGDAEALLRETAERCERALPPGDPLTRAVRQGLADVGKT
jgi:Tetratricopeptide repeat